jgi:hypothetical protein
VFLEEVSYFVRIQHSTYTYPSERDFNLQLIAWLLGSVLIMFGACMPQTNRVGN